MERAGVTVGRIVLVVAAFIGATALITSGFGYDFRFWVALAGALLVLAGMAVNRVWAAALPLVLATVFVGLAALDPGTDGSDGGWEYYGVLYALYAGCAAAALLVGVGLRRVLSRASAASRPSTTLPGSR